jgi:hypothetical protein
MVVGWLVGRLVAQEALISRAHVSFVKKCLFDGELCNGVGVSLVKMVIFNIYERKVDALSVDTGAIVNFSKCYYVIHFN